MELCHLEKLKLASDAASVAARALTLVGSPARWVKQAWALDARGHWVGVADPSACRFCLVGAVLRADYELHGVEVVYGAVPTSIAPSLGHISGRVGLLLDLLAQQVIERLEARGSKVRLISEADLAAGGEGGDRSVIRLHDLPVIFNGMKGIGHSEVFGMLLETGQTLIEIAESPKLADELVADRRLPDGG